MYIFVIFGDSLYLYIWKNSNLEKENLLGAEIVIV